MYHTNSVEGKGGGRGVICTTVLRQGCGSGYHMYHRNNAEGKGSRVIRSTTQTVQKARVGVSYVPHSAEGKGGGRGIICTTHTQCRRQG